MTSFGEISWILLCMLCVLKPPTILCACRQKVDRLLSLCKYFNVFHQRKYKWLLGSRLTAISDFINGTGVQSFPHPNLIYYNITK